MAASEGTASTVQVFSIKCLDLMSLFSVMTASGVPEWTVREQLVLASAVQRSGDKNW